MTTLPQLARVLGVPHYTARRIVALYSIPHTRGRLGRALLFSPEAVEMAKEALGEYRDRSKALPQIAGGDR